MRNQAREKRNILSKDSFTGKDPEPGTIENRVTSSYFWASLSILV
jgi:hypothetical protein